MTEFIDTIPFVLLGGVVLLTIYVLSWPSGDNKSSCIYKGKVFHSRRKVQGVSPVENTFTYPLHMLYLDLEELDGTFEGFLGSWLWSVNRRNVVAWVRSDYFGDQDKELVECVRDVVEQQAKIRPEGKVLQLTNPRYFGFSFNPVSIYYCHDKRGSLTHVVLEVSNTPWLDKRLYVLSIATNGSGSVLPVTWEKDFHVSPFMDMLHEYQWTLEPPGRRLDVKAINFRRNGPTERTRSFSEGLTGEKDVPEQAGLDGARRKYTATGNGEAAGLGDKSVDAGATAEMSDASWEHTTGQDAPTKFVSGKKNETTFVVGLHCERVELDGPGPLLCLLQQPLMTFSVVLWIHVQAFVVFCKGVQYQTPPTNSRELSLGDLGKHVVVFAIAGVWSAVSLVASWVGFIVGWPLLAIRGAHRQKRVE